MSQLPRAVTTNAFVLESPDIVVDDEIASRYVISINHDIAGVMTQWRELESVGHLTAFQTRAWLVPWYKIVAPSFNGSPLIVAVRDCASGRPLMLLFLCRRNRYGVARIEFPDFGVSDYNAPILAPDFRPSADEFERLWNEIVRALPRADLIQLEKMPETVAGRPNPMAWLAGSRPMRMRAWGFDLPETRAAYDQTLRSSVRKKLRWNRRTMDREGAVRFVRARSTAEGRKIFEALKRQRHARCEDIGAFDFIGHPVFSRFYESVVFDNWEDGFGALSALMVGDEFAATSFGLSHRGHYLLLVHSFEPGRWGNRSPGILGIDCAITHQIEAGSRYFDITVGNEPYKFQFCVKESLLYVREQAGSPVGRAVLALRRARTLAGQQIRRLPKSCLPKRWHD